MDTITVQWIERSDYDIKTASAMLSSRRYLYVAFMCQQSLEKLLKAVIASREETPPFMHNLPRLAEEAGVIDEMDQRQQQLLSDLNPYYIKARYGEYKDALSRICDSKEAKRLLQQTKEFSKWLKQKLKP